jgi:hypothetical protein
MGRPIDAKARAIAAADPIGTFERADLRAVFDVPHFCGSRLTPAA